MSESSRFQDVFENLKNIMTEFAGELVLVKNEPDDFHLDTKYVMRNKQPMFFGAVRITKNYVSYHLMPVYVFSELLSGFRLGLNRGCKENPVSISRHQIKHYSESSQN